MTERHEAWCPLNHSVKSADGSFGRVIVVVSENAGWGGESIVDGVIHDVTNGVEDSGEHVYLRRGDLGVGIYGFSAYELSNTLGWLQEVVEIMADHERHGVGRAECPSDVAFGEFATVVELRQGHSGDSRSAE